MYTPPAAICSLTAAIAQDDSYLPGNENYLVPLARPLFLKLEIVNCPSALVFGEVRHEIIVLRR